jgi:hypothetical protein
MLSISSLPEHTSQPTFGATTAQKFRNSKNSTVALTILNWTHYSAYKPGTLDSLFPSAILRNLCPSYFPLYFLPSPDTAESAIHISYKFSSSFRAFMFLPQSYYGISYILLWNFMLVNFQSAALQMSFVTTSFCFALKNLIAIAVLIHVDEFLPYF